MSNHLKSQTLRVSITVSLFGILLFVALALAIPLSWYSYLSHRETNVVAANEIMEGSAKTLEAKLEALIGSAETIARIISVWPDVETPPGPKSDPLRALFLSQLKSFTHFSTISVGYDDGSFYMVESALFLPLTRLKEIAAPEETAFVEQAIYWETTGSRVLARRFLDDQGSILATDVSDQPEYDPRERAWFIDNGEENRMLQSSIYKFAGTDAPGITISHRHVSGTVGIDLTLAQIEEFLRDEPQAEEGMLAIIGPDATLLASSAQDSRGLRAAQDLIKGATGDTLVERGVIEIGGQPWIARVFQAPIGTETNELLAVAEPISVIAAPVREVTRNTLIASVLVTLASVPLIWFVSLSISRPLIALARDADSIRRFDLLPRVSKPSVVDEIYELQTATARMRTALSVFVQYVPKTLVQKLIQSDEIPDLGGERRTITVLFLDLENFTDMSANLEPEQVMTRMSEFFEVVTQVLLSNGATIDKYIGDAVMAFWNAPEDTTDHEYWACKAALEVREAANVIVSKWNDAPKPLRTRIGIHSGEAVVGNVGSSDRMNYTALGATVNLAARLETLNRERTTDILVSEQIVHSCAEQFSFEFATQTRLKGFHDATNVYSLTN